MKSTKIVIDYREHTTDGNCKILHFTAMVLAVLFQVSLLLLGAYLLWTMTK